MAHARDGGGATWRQPHKSEIKKKQIFFLDTMMWTVLCDRRFNLNQLQKSADD